MNDISIRPIYTKNSGFASNVSKTQAVKAQRFNSCNNANTDFGIVNYSNYRAYYYNPVSFKSSEESLFHAFLKSDSSKIYQFLCDAEKATPTQARCFLDTILADKNLAVRFIKEITENPRQSAQIVKTLTQKLGGGDNFRDWYFADGGYINAFGNYVGNHVYHEAKTESDMLAFMPNWVLSKIWEKAKALGHDPIIGELPANFGNRMNFIDIVNRLRSLNSGEKCHFNTRGRGYILRNINKREKSSNIVIPEGSDKSYIIKIDRVHSNPLYDRMRPNSSYLEAAVGHYITTHNCEDAAKFCYYDLYHDALLTEFTEGNVPQYANTMERNKQTPDLLALGIFCNDVAPENYRQAAGRLKVIDLGHVSYFDRLKPGDQGNTMDLPNLARPNFPLTYGDGLGDFVINAQGAKNVRES